MPFGICTRMDPRKHVSGGVHTGVTWRIPLKRSYMAAMRPVVRLLWPLVIMNCLSYGIGHWLVEFSRATVPCLMVMMLLSQLTDAVKLLLLLLLYLQPSCTAAFTQCLYIVCVWFSTTQSNEMMQWISESVLWIDLFVKMRLFSYYGHYIFVLWFLLSIFLLLLSSFFSFFSFPRLFSAVADWMSTALPHMVWP